MTSLETNHTKFIDLRAQYPVFHFDSFTYQIDENDIKIQFFYHANEIKFEPKIKVRFGKYLSQSLSQENLEGFIFNIGLIELISYWKCVASPIVMIHSYLLNTRQQKWWKKLYYKGLGEYFYQNSISTSIDDFLQFQFDPNQKVNR